MNPPTESQTPAPRLFRRAMTAEDVNRIHRNTAVERLGIECVELGDDFVRARMPVDARTVQPAGLLHGGASVVLAETLGSLAATLCQEPG
ncbi:MAG TPA: hotdog fold thioesterase, partial [Quisquiliibacterium sp.]|nr:hotdog fold thioesterase [Quisquiliibacterium sp.]